MTARRQAQKQASQGAGLQRHFHAQVRLLSAAAIGVAVAIFAPLDQPMLRVLAGWNAFGWLYIALAFTMMMRAELEGIKRQASLEEESRTAVLLLTLLGSGATFLAIVAQLSALVQEIGTLRTLTFALSFSTILVSWLLVQIAYTLYYAHEFHGESRKASRGAGGGLKFPGEAVPDYLDFLYFALCVGTTMQTSDVQITSRHMRRRVTAHGLLSFVFNMLVIALMVNLTAQLVQG